MARIEQDELGELLSAYVDGELSTGEKAVVEKLLREDATARHLLEQLRRTVDATRSLPRHPAPASLVSDVQAMLERSALLDDAPRTPIKPHRDRTPWAARLSIAAMVGLVVVGGWYFLQEPARNRGTIAPSSSVSRDFNEAAKSEPLAKESERSRSAGAVASGDRRTVDEKLAAGVELVALRAHSFEAEGLRLQLNVKDTKEGDALVERVSKRLADEKLVNLETKAGNGSPASSGFYLRGSAGKNFDAPRESQILVRATPAQLEQVLNDVAISKPSDSDAMLVAGPLRVRGLQQSQQVLNASRRSQNAQPPAQGPTPTDKLAMSAPKESPSGDFVTDLIKIVGIDPALLPKDEATTVAIAAHADEEGEKARDSADEAGARSEARRDEPADTLVGRNIRRLPEPVAAPLEPEPLVTMIIQMVPPPSPAPSPKPIDSKPATRSNSGRSSS